MDEGARPGNPGHPHHRIRYSDNVAVEAMKLGAFDFLGKPLSNPDELRLLVRKVFDDVASQHESALFREEQSVRFNCGEIIAGDPGCARCSNSPGKSRQQMRRC